MGVANGASQARSVGAWIEMLAASSPGARRLQLDGVLGSLCPAAPRRGIANSVIARDADALLAATDELDGAYLDAGVAAWCAWLPPGNEDRDGELAERGIVPDGSPAAMVAALADPPAAAEVAAGYELTDEGSPVDLGRLNDLAYGHFGADALGPALADPPPGLGLHLHEARDAEGAAVATAGFIDTADPETGELDAAVVFVATDPAHQRRGLGGAVMARGMRAAAERGCATSSLQASGDGEPVYRRLGYVTEWRFRLHERRFATQPSGRLPAS